MSYTLHWTDLVDLLPDVVAEAGAEGGFPERRGFVPVHPEEAGVPVVGGDPRRAAQVRQAVRGLHDEDGLPQEVLCADAAELFMELPLALFPVFAGRILQGRARRADLRAELFDDGADVDVGVLEDVVPISDGRVAAVQYLDPLRSSQLSKGALRRMLLSNSVWTLRMTLFRRLSFSAVFSAVFSMDEKVSGGLRESRARPAAIYPHTAQKRDSER